MEMKHKSLWAALIGTLIEWYDYGLFMYLAPVLEKLYFPHNDQTKSLLTIFMVFAVGYFLRPIGGFVFGSIADRYGRIVSLRITVLLISCSSIGISCLPTYASWGYCSTVLLILLRLMQGISVGGEFAGSMVYLTEIAPAKHRILLSGLANSTSNVGILLGAGICTLLVKVLSEATFNSVGWRLPFFLAGLIGILGYRARKSFIESELFISLQQKNQLCRAPIKTLFSKQKYNLMIAILFCMMGACGIYTILVYFSTYLQVVKHFSLSDALLIESTLLVLTIILIPIMSLLAERIGPERVLAIGVLGYMSSSILVFYFLPENNFKAVLALMIPLIFFMCTEQGVMPYLLAQVFPTEIRYTAVSVSYNMSFAYIGGFAPFYNTYLIEKMQSPIVPGICIFVAALLTGIGLILFKKRRLD